MPNALNVMHIRLKTLYDHPQIWRCRAYNFANILNIIALCSYLGKQVAENILVTIWNNNITIWRREGACTDHGKRSRILPDRQKPARKWFLHN